jgi:hypothetical protein
MHGFDTQIWQFIEVQDVFDQCLHVSGRAALCARIAHVYVWLLMSMQARACLCVLTCEYARSDARVFVWCGVVW